MVKATPASTDLGRGWLVCREEGEAVFIPEHAYPRGLKEILSEWPETEIRNAMDAIEYSMHGCKEY